MELKSLIFLRISIFIIIVIFILVNSLFVQIFTYFLLIRRIDCFLWNSWLLLIIILREKVFIIFFEKIFVFDCEVWRLVVLGIIVSKSLIQTFILITTHGLNSLASMLNWGVYRWISTCWVMWRDDLNFLWSHIVSLDNLIII